MDELFLTLSPLLAGDAGPDSRLRLVEAADLVPPVGLRLLSLRRHEEHLFLRYELEPRRRVTRLETGAELRRTGDGRCGAVVCVNGGQARELEGTWSASIEWLVRRVAPRLPELTFAEVRYRVRSWRRLDLCIEDARAALHEVAAERTLLVGFSMGGAVAISAADDPSVAGVLGLAPWIPDALDVSPIAGKRLAVLHGALDRGSRGSRASPPPSRARRRAGARGGRRVQLHARPGRGPRARAACSVGRPRPAPARRPLGGARRGRAPPVPGRGLGGAPTTQA